MFASQVMAAAIVFLGIGLGVAALIEPIITILGFVIKYLKKVFVKGAVTEKEIK